MAMRHLGKPAVLFAALLLVAAALTVVVADDVAPTVVTAAGADNAVVAPLSAEQLAALAPATIENAQLQLPKGFRPPRMARMPRFPMNITAANVFVGDHPTNVGDAVNTTAAVTADAGGMTPFFWGSTCNRAVQTSAIPAPPGARLKKWVEWNLRIAGGRTAQYCADFGKTSVFCGVAPAATPPAWFNFRVRKLSSTWQFAFFGGKDFKWCTDDRVKNNVACASNTISPLETFGAKTFKCSIAGGGVRRLWALASARTNYKSMCSDDFDNRFRCNRNLIGDYEAHQMFCWDGAKWVDCEPY